MFVFNFGRLRMLRRKNKLTQDALGRMLGCTGSVVGRWENGETPITAEDLARISYILGEPNFQSYFYMRESENDFSQS